MWFSASCVEIMKERAARFPVSDYIGVGSGCDSETFRVVINKIGMFPTLSTLNLCVASVLKKSV